eukprot:TRINITY_DN9661_c0_g1_i1.p1 TRINITY_DN9661_c0_g1~~TRINITY_DN9661_c0_g1_i1.p1  ORF type:complete len:698 (-),score=295.45 TRINITY_DN9661_c0_g1_i1:430-2523(-)
MSEGSPVPGTSEGIRRRPGPLNRKPSSRWHSAVKAVATSQAPALQRSKPASIINPESDFEIADRAGLFVRFLRTCIATSLLLALYLFWSSRDAACGVAVAFALWSSAALLYYRRWKNALAFVLGGVAGLFVFPLLAQAVMVGDAVFGSIGLWSVVAPFAAVCFLPDHSGQVFGAFAAITGTMGLVAYVFGEYTPSVDLVTAVAVLFAMFFTMRFTVTETRKFKSRLGVANALLLHRNRTLIGEKEELQETVVKLTQEGGLGNLKEVAMDSPAEKIISIMQKLKAADALGQYAADIDTVIALVGSGVQLYAANVEDSLSAVSPKLMDNETRALLVYYQDQGQKLVKSPSLHGNMAELPAILARRPSTHDFNRLWAKTIETNSGIKTLLAKINEWNFDVFQLADLSEGRPCYYVGQATFRQHDLLKKFDIDENKLHNLLLAIEKGYRRENQYHNNTHAADVTQTLNFFLTSGGLGSRLTDADILAALLAALMHDYDHPGVNNAFEINSGSDLALRYNDVSVLENHHVAAASALLKDPDKDILGHLEPAVRKEVRQTLIELVLSTDFSKHFEVLGQFKSRRAAGGLLPDKREDRLLCLKMALKAADISHTAKSSALHLRWTERITDEFFAQGDKERDLHLAVSPFMDRSQPDVPKSQTGFLGFFVLPLYKALVEEFPAAAVCLEQLEQNLESWRSKQQTS